MPIGKRKGSIPPEVCKVQKMKRMIALAMTAVMLFAALAVTAFAGEYSEQDGRPDDALYFGEVKRGTPKIDGKMDEIYKDSIYFYIGQRAEEQYCPMKNDENQDPNWSSANPLKKEDCYGYILWDDDYMYLYARAYDANIVDSDCIGFFFKYDQFCYAVNVNFDGESSMADTQDYDMYMSQFITNKNEEEGYWEVEIALACYSLEADPDLEFGFHLFYANYDEPYGMNCDKYTSGVFFNDYFILGEEVAAGAETPADTTASEGDTTTVPAGDVTTAPNADTTTAAPSDEKSGCGSVVGTAAVVLLAVTAVPAVLVRKKED